MEYVTDINEIFRIFEECRKKAVYKSIGTDEEGSEIAVPVFSIGEGKAV